MTFGQLFGALFGWLGDFVGWVFEWVPRYEIVQSNERGVKYHRGKQPWELKPGCHWYVPNLDDIEKHHVCRDVLVVDSLPLETADAPPRRVEVGMVLTYHIVDVLKYEVENVNADVNMAEAAQGALQDIVTSHTWDDLRGDTAEGTRLGGKLARRMGKALEKFGVEVESCRPTDQVTLDSATRHFGIAQVLSFGGGQ
jgi:regulator of protease activity HflC (stomatin/prohibitin superfamily)